MWSIRYCALRTAHCIFCQNCVILISIVYAMYTLQYVCYITRLIWRKAGHLMGCFFLLLAQTVMNMQSGIPC